MQSKDEGVTMTRTTLDEKSRKLKDSIQLTFLTLTLPTAEAPVKNGWRWNSDCPLLSCPIKRKLLRSRNSSSARLFVIASVLFVWVGLTSAQPSPLTIGASLLPQGEINAPYNSDLGISGGVPLYAISFVKGALPLGLNVDSVGVITGTPASLAKSTSFTIKVTDRSGSSVSKKFKINIFKALGIATASLKSGKQGEKYAATVKAAGGKKTYGWSIVSGYLPAGLAFDTATAKITGAPTETGSFDLTLQVSDSLGGKAQKSFSFVVNPGVECPAAEPGHQVTYFGGFGQAWNKIPVVTVAAAPQDPRLTFTLEAVDCWNRRFAELGTPFRLGPLVHTTQIVPADFLTLLSEGGEPEDFPESVINMEGDIILALSDADFISFAAHFPSGERVIIGIKSQKVSPLTLPNVPRNVIAHELGHAIGLGHNDDPTKLMCGRPAPCRPDAFESGTPRFFPLTVEEEAMLLDVYPVDWIPSP